MRLASWWCPPYRGRVMLAGMHRRGYIAPSATLHHTALRLGEHIFIGDRVLIYQADPDSGPVDIGTRVRLSREVIIETGAGGGLTIGDDTYVHPRCQFSAYHSSIHIGRGVAIAPYCAFYPYNHGMAPDLPIGRQPLRSRGDILIEDEVWLGYGVIVLDGVRIGSGAVVGAGSVVVHDVPPGSVVQGVPARVIMFRGDLPNHNGVHMSVKEA
jgi:carbonic anhydrase/acetyltransferase-like protein (isoleucine patch superfamily)